MNKQPSLEGDAGKLCIEGSTVFHLKPESGKVSMEESLSIVELEFPRANWKSGRERCSGNLVGEEAQSSVEMKEERGFVIGGASSWNVI